MTNIQEQPKIIQGVAGFEIGDVVKLKRDVRCDRDREDYNNKTCAITRFLVDIEGGLFLKDGLRGCRYWNVDDVVKVS